MLRWLGLVCVTVVLSSVAAAEREFVVGAKWDIAYRIFKNVEEDRFYARIHNRNDFGVRVSLGIASGAIGAWRYDRDVIIDRTGTVVLGPFDNDLSRHTVAIDRLSKGYVVRKLTPVYDAQGQACSTETCFFIGEEDAGVDVLVGTSLWRALDQLGIRYQRDDLTRRIQTGRAYGHGFSANDRATEGVRYLEIPSETRRGGQPIWTLQFELDAQDVIRSVFKKHLLQ